MDSSVKRMILLLGWILKGCTLLQWKKKVINTIPKYTMTFFLLNWKDNTVIHLYSSINLNLSLQKLWNHFSIDRVPWNLIFMFHSAMGKCRFVTGKENCAQAFCSTGKVLENFTWSSYNQNIYLLVNLFCLLMYLYLRKHIHKWQYDRS